MTIYFVTLAVRPVSHKGRGSAWIYESGFVRGFPPTTLERTRERTELGGVDREIVFFRPVSDAELSPDELEELEGLLRLSGAAYVPVAMVVGK